MLAGRRVLLTFLRTRTYQTPREGGTYQTPREGGRFLSSSLGPDLVLPATEHRTWVPDGAVNLRVADTGPCSATPISVPTMFKAVVEEFPNKVAVRFRGPSGEDLNWSYSQYHEEVLNAAKGFISLGLERFHTVSILGNNSPEWAVSSLAAVYAGGFANGIYSSNNAAACQYCAHDSRSNVLVVEDEAQLDKILQVKKDLPFLKAIVQYKGNPSTPGVVGWKELVEMGRGASDVLVEDRMKEMAVNQCCLLLYTSGTTGNPKGVMVSHDGLVFGSRMSSDTFGWRYGKEFLFNYLPMSHLAGHLDIYWAISKASTICIADPTALKGNLIEQLKFYRPTRFMGVPRVWEKIEEGIRQSSKDNKGIKKALVNWATNMAARHHDREMAGTADNSLRYRVAKKLVLSKVHEALGLENAVNIEGIATGSAVCSKSTHDFFKGLDVRLLDLYGMTESGSLIAANIPGPGNYRLGTVGRAFPPFVEATILDPDEKGEGEIVARSRAVCMGYLNNREKTLEALDDEGWLHTGDKVKMDDDGFFSVVGRIKEIIITAGGENVAPINIENEVKVALADVVSNVMVVGEGRKHLTCILTLKVAVDPDTLVPTSELEPVAKKWITDNGGGDVSTVEDVLASQGWDRVAAAIDAGIEAANEKAISNAAKIKKWMVVTMDFSLPGGELTPSLKLKRFSVLEKYNEEIERLYL